VLEKRSKPKAAKTFEAITIKIQPRAYATSITASTGGLVKSHGRISIPGACGQLLPDSTARNSFSAK
jgi:hypothetical protein